ncbi:unnamed protein product, partial [Ectocarpus fasciculatus]
LTIHTPHKHYNCTAVAPLPCQVLYAAEWAAGHQQHARRFENSQLAASRPSSPFSRPQTTNLRTQWAGERGTIPLYHFSDSCERKISAGEVGGRRTPHHRTRAVCLFQEEPMRGRA